MRAFLYLVKLLLALACLGLTIFVIIRGESTIKAHATIEVYSTPINKPTADLINPSARLLSDIRQKSAELADEEKAFEKRKADITKEAQDEQAEIARGNQSYQFLNAIVQEIVMLTDERKGGQRDDKLKDILVQDVVEKGFKVNESAPAAGIFPAAPH